MGADPRRPIANGRVLPRVREQTFPYSEEIPVAAPGPIGYSDGHFGASVPLGAAEAEGWAAHMNEF